MTAHSESSRDIQKLHNMTGSDQGNQIDPNEPSFKTTRSVFTDSHFPGNPNLGICLNVNPDRTALDLIRHFSPDFCLIPSADQRLFAFTRTDSPMELAEALSSVLTENLIGLADAVYSYGEVFQANSDTLSDLNELLDLKLSVEKDGTGVSDYSLLFEFLAQGDSLKALFSPGRIGSLNEELILTFSEFVRQNLSPGDTARNLYIHRNTLKYRLDRIHTLTGIDPRNHAGASLIRLLLADSAQLSSGEKDRR